MASADRPIPIEQHTVAAPFYEFLSDVVSVFERAGIDTEGLLRDVDRKINRLKQDFPKAIVAFSIMDPNFNDLPESEQRERIYQAQDTTYGRQYYVWLRKLDDESKSGKPGSKQAKAKYDSLFQAVDAYEDPRLETRLTGPHRSQIFELPMSCPHPPVSDFFTTPVLVRNESLDDMSFLANAIRIHSHSVETSVEAMKTAYRERLLTPSDLLQNSEVQKRIARQVGVLEEGEHWEDFMTREDTKVLKPGDNTSVDKIGTGLVLGRQTGVEARLGKPAIAYFGGVPISYETQTKYPGIDINIRLFADHGTNSHDGDRNIPLDQLVATGRATPAIMIMVPTDYLLLISEK
ncbi:MAG TPA: hypothetical protein VLE91_00585 [Candidatus Saccharimonadales bacterium]|nr:hypothetical protein [Candidatus Saccharimonadales bacterium]